MHVDFATFVVNTFMPPNPRNLEYVIDISCQRLDVSTVQVQCTFSLRITRQNKCLTEDKMFVRYVYIFTGTCHVLCAWSVTALS